MNNPFVSWAGRVYVKTEYLNFGREIIARWAREVVAVRGAEPKTSRVLDIGFGSGQDLANVRAALSGCRLDLLGIDCQPSHVEQGRQQGVTVYCKDIEREPFPLAEGSVDLVIANQIIEHTKEIFWVFSEISRVLKRGGHAIVGVPNMASLHNRILFLFGIQPTCLELLGPHVRGVTYRDFKKFVETGGFFVVKELKGSNFYPFPPGVSKLLSRVFPALSASLFFLIERTQKQGQFSEVLRSRSFETPFLVTGGTPGG
ncbi:MAG: methyltransferase domain-containing protein [Candidatus Omnitrophica bacterium]|nr:methyltransferase domain-containing protein [Candidatus Omnitrophota bacterium]